MEYTGQNQGRQEEASLVGYSNASSNPQVSVLIPWPAFYGMERMCQGHGSN